MCLTYNLRLFSGVYVPYVTFLLGSIFNFKCKETYGWKCSSIMKYKICFSLFHTREPGQMLALASCPMIYRELVVHHTLIAISLTDLR